ncbi:hypothetical protein GF351_04525 [Candidatus Woesearchaeota archaeon]|nr:hypothetical protein [Candidatus Woesearchaeota archaeon]
MKRLLLHACCGPCATYAADLLSREYEVELFFYNPNIYPAKEHAKRLENTEIVSRKLDIPLSTGGYDPERWLKAVRGHEQDNEGGQRCSICFRLRLQKTAEKAKKKGFDAFSTTLTISPFKDSRCINKTGRQAAKDEGTMFLELDLKKDNGFRKSVQMSRDMHLYRQKYCGCIYSMPKP